MKKYYFLLTLPLTLFFSCSSGDKKEVNSHIDTTPDSSLTKELNDSVHIQFRRLIAGLPVPFEVMQKITGSNIPFRGDLLNSPQNVSSYSTQQAQAVNLGVYGADFAYMIAQNKLGDAGQYLKCVRQIADGIVIPSAFDEKLLNRYRDNSTVMDSMGSLVSLSYRRIDSTLQGNDRINLATLVISGGWIESLYLTTQQIGDETQNKSNKVLFDMLTQEQPHIAIMSNLLASFRSDSMCVRLHNEFETIKKVYPSGADLPPDQFSAQVKKLRDVAAEIRNDLIHAQ